MRVSQRLVALAVVLSSTSVFADTVSINGAGATFPAPLYTKWFSEYRQADPSVEINYQPIGSGGGIRQLTDKTVDFGASDAPMTDEQLTKVSPAVIHIPTVLGAVVLTYNLPEVKKPLQLSGEVIADLFLGKINKWNDAAIAKLNPGVQLPATDILVAHRSDGSGTTAVFSDYLSKVSPEWKQKVGTGPALNWPTGLGGKGNDGVTNTVKQTPGAIGYIELTYAETNKLPYASLKNKAGKFVVPSPATVSNAAAGALKDMPKDFRVSITDAAGKDAYPISAFTYLLVYQKMDAKKGQKLVKFLDWALKAGQKDAEPLHYAPLPKQMVSKVQARVKDIHID
ncbi:MAG: phosphate ABC transporter substrate-binding protein PstS [Bdellovibrionia bacterium]